MPIISRCDVSGCAYNTDKNCHARAITVGDLANPGCDTFFDNIGHTKETQRIAGVGACKVTNCRHNNDLECTADSIEVGFSAKKINCLTYAPQKLS